MKSIKLIIFILFGLFLVGCIGNSEYDTETQKKLTECDKDPVWKETCYSFVAQEKNDLSICEKIKEEPTHAACYIEIAINLEDSSICEKLEYQIQKDVCFHDFAVNLEKPEVCEKIVDPDTYDSCNSLTAK